MKNTRLFSLGSLLMILSGAAFGEEVQEAVPTALSLAGIPALNYSSDAGFGFGVIGSLYGKTPAIKPYSFAADLQLFVTTKGQHSHFLRLDWLRALNLPLRFRAKIGFNASINENYCGIGASANCDAIVGRDQNFNLTRYFEGFGVVEGRWQLRPKPHQIEITGAYRGSLYEPGTWGDLTPYPNSRFALEFPDGQKGFASVFEWGLMLDSRDQEASPTSGYWIEASLRDSLPALGSTWQYFGMNLSGRIYLPLDPEKRLVLAAQMIADGLIGDAPVAEMARVANSLRFSAFGGANIGRGIRDRHFPGRVKLLKQLELRYRFVDFNISTQRFNVYSLLFGDFAAIAARLENLDAEPKKVLAGFGGGFRVAWNTDFIIRLDLGFSPIESYSPKIYIQVGNVF